MDRDVLERLATDRAFGALTPDVEHLLDSYMRLDPPSATSVDGIGRTIALAREALAEKPPSSMPAFPVAGFMQIERWRKRVQQFTYAAGLAACLSIGLGLGRMTAPASVIEVAGPNHGSAVHAAGANQDEAPDPQTTYATELARSTSQENGSGFWSVERLMQQRERDRLQVRNPPSPGVRIQWPHWNRPT